MSVSALLEKCPERLLTPLILVLILAIGGIDYVTGWQISLSLFYLIPVTTASWYAGFRPGVLAATCSAMGSLVADLLWGVPYTHQFIPYWNAITRLILFLLIVRLMAALRVHLKGLQHVVQEQSSSFQEETAQRRRFAQESADWQRRYEFVAAASGQIVFDLSFADGSMAWSGSVSSVLGYDLQEMSGGVAQWQELIDPAEQEMVSRRLVESCRSGCNFDAEFSLRHKAGHYVRMLICGFTIHEDHHPAERLVGIMQDITERKRLEVEILKAQKLESLGLLAGGIAHDFNNLLTAILGNINLAERHAHCRGSVIRYLEQGQSACVKATALAQQLLTFARGGEPLLQAITLEELMREIVTFSLSGSQLGCEFVMEPGLWAVMADEGQLSQVLNNLVINAKQAMPNGGLLTVKAANYVATRQDAPLVDGSRYVRLSIIDQGLGIPAESLPMIFDPYFTTKQTGSGLGLTSVYSIVKRHEGHIQVDSAPGEGTAFHMYIPATYKLPAETPDAVPSDQTFPGLRILLMDDDEMVLEMAAEILRSFGCAVTTARDGAEAVRLYREALDHRARFSLVILDLTVPGGMGGKEAHRLLKAADPMVLSVVSSGYSDDASMAEYRLQGFSGVLRKPYSLNDLGEILTLATARRTENR